MTKTKEEIQDECADNIAHHASQLGPREVSIINRLQALEARPEIKAQMLAIGTVTFRAATELLRREAPDLAEIGFARGALASRSVTIAAFDPST
jgi:hypothetical protein